MNETKQEKKVRKKAYRKARRKATRPWKGLTFFSGIISIVLIPILVFLSMFDNTVAAFVGGSFWKLKNEDKNAVYYESDFETTEEMNQYGLELCETVEEEGAALLMNENNALPLEKGAKVSCFSNSSVNLVYGGTGSGNIDASSAEQYDPDDYEEAKMPTMKAKNGKKLVDMIGLSYDDEAWDELLDQLSFKDMVSLIGDSFHWTMPLESVQAPGTRDENGPQGLTASLIASDKTEMDATAFTSEDVMAATFNRDLMTEIGKVIGNNCLKAGVSILYGPGNNIHRTPYGGRNFEYYSEDGFLSGEMSAYEVAAIEEKGVGVVMKHFALNDSEQDRIGLGVWVNEQAAREIYLKAFQAPVEKGNANGVMIAYTRWGCTWSGGSKPLVTGILREEWGCDGLIITDNVLTTYVNGVDGVLAGVSTFDAMLPYVTKQLPDYKNDAVIVNAMREACHRNLYAIANSSGMNGIGKDTEIKDTGLLVVDVVRTLLIVFGALFVLSLVMWITRKRRFKKNYVYAPVVESAEKKSEA